MDGRDWIIALGCVALVVGCGQSDDDASDGDVPVPSAPVPTAEVDRLELRLKSGDRFPLMKSVSQELHQASVVGGAKSRSQLDLLLTITVEDVQPEKKRLGVRYNRVRYWHEIDGESVHFDSSIAGASVPREALPYRGLVGNGFSFWIGPDNQILEPIGFSEFLERCVRDVPVEERQEVLRQFTRTTSDEGIANFIDDSIGLLPYEVDGKERTRPVAEGDTWSRERRLMHPVPIVLKTRCTLRTIGKGAAEIDILGNISPATNDESADETAVVPASGVREGDRDKASAAPKVVVRGGNAYGSCTIDRATGLPLRSHVERFLDMTVRLPNGLTFEQRKRTTTTIQAFPQQSGGDPATGAQPIEITPSFDEKPARNASDDRSRLRR